MGKSCIEEFQKWCQERTRCPLPSGVYKLQESQRWLISSLGLVDEIRNTYPRAVQGARGRLKSLPKGITRELGWNVVSAVEALAGDGLPNALVKSLATYARADADALVTRLASLEECLSPRGIDVELFHIWCGHSRLERLLTEAVLLIDNVLREGAPYSQRGSRTAAFFEEQ